MPEPEQIRWGESNWETKYGICFPDPDPHSYIM
jgi:hypothetical protein